MEIVKILLEEPERIQTLIINIVKLVLTVLITHVIFPIPELMSLDPFEDINLNLSLESMLFFIVKIVSVWVVIWTISFGFFVLIISFWKKSNKKKKNNSIQPKEIKEMLKAGRIYSQSEKGFIRPTRHIALVAEVGQIIKEDHSFNLINTKFAQWLYIAVVILGYLILKFEMSFSKIIWIVIFLITIYFAIRFWRLIDRILEAFKDNSIEIHNFLQFLLFRKVVIDIVENNFSGQLNKEETGYVVKFGAEEYEVRDFAFFNNEMGNIILFKLLQNQVDKFDGYQIIVSNIEPDEQLRMLIKKMKIKAYIQANNEEELLVRMFKLLSVIESDNDQDIIEK